MNLTPLPHSCGNSSVTPPSVLSRSFKNPTKRQRTPHDWSRHAETGAQVRRSSTRTRGRRGAQGSTRSLLRPLQNSAAPLSRRTHTRQRTKGSHFYLFKSKLPCLVIERLRSGSNLLYGGISYSSDCGNKGILYFLKDRVAFFSQLHSTCFPVA